MVKYGGMTPEQKAFQMEKNENDFKVEVVQRFQKLESFLQGMERDLDKLNALYQQHQVESIHTAHEISDNCMASLKEIRKVMGDIQHENKILSDEYHSILNYISNHYVTKINHSRDYIDSIDSNVKMKQEISSHRNEILAILAKQNHDFEAKFADFLQKQALKPNPIPELEKSFHEKLDLVSLNGQNSVLRSSNNEKHIQLIEKKIENIYQLIKQQDLKMAGA